MLDAFSSAGTAAAAALAEPFLSPAGRLGYPALLAGLAFAAVAFRLQAPPAQRGRLLGFAAFALPGQIYRHRSLWVDLQIFALAQLLSPARRILGGATAGAAAVAIAAWLGSVAGPRPAVEAGPAEIALLSALLVLALDFGTYATHRLSHRLPVLWAFHRVHHSAEVLSPVTVMRKHPVYDMLAVLLDIAIVAPIQGAILYFWGDDIGPALAVWVNIAFASFNLAAGILRHSHIWISFGPGLSRILVSPAMHQIHHSRAPAHWDRNYGEMFAIWDWMFGSLYLPRGRETLRFGLADDEGQPHPSLAAAMIEPFVHAWRQPRAPASPAGATPKAPA